MGKRTGIIIGAAIAALALPAASQAATRTVYMGPPPAAQKSLDPTGSDVNAFFPTTISVHKGDLVSFVAGGLHSLDMPPAAGRPLPLFSPTPKTISLFDAAGVPFWFNGQPELAFTRGFLPPRFGRTVTKGPARILSGVPFRIKPKPLKIRFIKAGNFRYYCNLHPHMEGTVKVRAKTTRVPSAKAVAATVKKQVASALRIAKTLVANTQVPANSVSVSAEGAQGVSYFGMLPQNLTVAAGTTVRFFMPKGSTEEHTATFGPGDVDDTTSFLGGLAALLEQPIPDQRALYPSEPPGSAPASMSPALHGDGFWNSGALDDVPPSPLPLSGDLTFNEPGIYPYVCLIHPAMKATVTVQ
ncbi:MAG TPA: hypothetical protein VHN18_06905 [Micromonosporaceae bacterium]|nr:hypothetical protein [Micromonosporaceae bacterium]